MFLIDNRNDPHPTGEIKDPYVVHYGPDLDLRRLQDGSKYQVVEVFSEPPSTSQGDLERRVRAGPVSGTRSCWCSHPARMSVVGHRIHDDEPDTSEATLRTLLDAECPEWAGLAVEYLRTSGTATPCGECGSVGRGCRRAASAAPWRSGERRSRGGAPTTALDESARIGRLHSEGAPRLAARAIPASVVGARLARRFGCLVRQSRTRQQSRWTRLRPRRGRRAIRRLPAISPQQHAPLVSGEVRSSRSCEDWSDGSTIRDGVNLS